MLLETIRLAAEALSRNLMRSLLTMLGIVIGVAAVVAMVTIGNGATARVEAEIAKLGTDLLTLNVGQNLRGSTSVSISGDPFDYDDVAALRKQVRGLRAVAPFASDETRVIAGRRNWMANVSGTENDYFIARSWKLAAGRFFTGHEAYTGKPVCIIGQTVRESLFPDSDGLGEFMRIDSIPCTVVGVLSMRGQSGSANDDDNIVAVPFNIYQRRIQGTPDIDSIVMAVYRNGNTRWAKSQVRQLMRERRGIDGNDPEDFAVLDMRQAAEAMAATTRTMTSLLGAIAAVSLLVGGIGIMNIMLVSVTERTREIGVRLAIGALPGQVMAQFMVEAMMLTGVGGVLGAVVGLLLAAMVSTSLGVPFVPDAGIVAIALSVSFVLGIVFGYTPAMRAARLDPIEALRHS
jgi:putative ABC transport system permease protein